MGCVVVAADVDKLGSVPHSNHACVAAPRGFTVPSNRALVPVTSTAAVVTACGTATTVTFALPTTVPLVKSMRAVPDATAVTTPEAFTVAIAVLLLDHAVGLALAITLPRASKSRPVYVIELPTTSVAEGGAT